MPKNIAQRMTRQMKSFIWENKRPLMNWMDVTQPKENRGLGLPDIEVRLEAIQVMWLKKYLALSQTSFSHISINSSSILTVSMATESP